MTKTKRILLVSGAIILLCMSIISGMTYALFTENISVENHLKAGNLDVQLTRTKLEYAILDGDGYLKETTVTDPLDLTGITEENVFGLKSSENLVVPGSYFDAELTITNAGNVAIEYDVKLVILSEDVTEDLADQLLVTVKRLGADGTTFTEVVSKKLKEMTSKDAIFKGELAAGTATDVFSVRIEFLDDVDTDNTLAVGDNNKAMDDTVVFDLFVEAVQATK